MSLTARIQVRLDGFDLDVGLDAQPGRVLAIVGPNGAGKTTALRTLQGTAALDGGRIELEGTVLDDPAVGTFVLPEQRRVGMVHQDLLLFPHLSARDNIAFGLRARGTSRSDARRCADEQLAALGLQAQAGSRPAALSGGQAQRVALLRALAIEPRLLLLDEPLAALDPTTRGETRRDLRRTLDGFGGVAIVVTHDPIDALTLADDVVVIEQGRVAQAGTLAEVTARPRSRHVAELIGTNLVRGAASGTRVVSGGAVIHLAEPVEGDVFVIIPPSAITLQSDEPTSSARNRWPMTVAGIEPSGERARIRLEGPLPLVAEITATSLASLRIQVGEVTWASVKATELHAYLR
ncbi:MAG: transporter ATP-binding protein [Ilumatobacteraceae bacterium]|nr:transporter ATP-binding protein [Ilumatobacteraceae bacterium]